MTENYEGIDPLGFLLIIGGYFFVLLYISFWLDPSGLLFIIGLIASGVLFIVFQDKIRELVLGL